MFSRAPGTLKSLHDVPIPRPRRVFQIHGSPGFEETYDRIWNDLAEELDSEEGGDEGRSEAGGDGEE